MVGKSLIFLSFFLLPFVCSATYPSPSGDDEFVVHDCVYDTPQDSLGATPVGVVPFQFAHSVCTYTVIQNQYGSLNVDITEGNNYLAHPISFDYAAGSQVLQADVNDVTPYSQTHPDAVVIVTDPAGQFLCSDYGECLGSTTPLSVVGDLELASSSSSPVYTQDSGNISFGLAILIVLQGLITCGLIFNSFFKRN